MPFFRLDGSTEKLHNTLNLNKEINRNKIRRLLKKDFVTYDTIDFVALKALHHSINQTDLIPYQSAD